MSGAPAAAADYLTAQNGTELSVSLGVPMIGVAVLEVEPPPSGADAVDGSVSLGFEVDATPETFDADGFTASLADELGVDAATLSTAAGTMCRLPCLLEPPNLPLWAM